MELYHLIIVNLTYAFLMLGSGFVFSMHSLKGLISTEDRLSKKGLWSFVPILTVLLLVVVFHVELHYALIVVVLFLFVFYRYGPNSILAVFRHGFSPEVILLILGVMFFKEAMENSGAVKNLSQLLLEKGIPVFPILFLLPFITGILTGITVGFVGSTFPLLVSLVEHTSVAAISFAFASGFIGVLLSPVHICLVLTREYFKADLWKMYKKMMPASLVIFTGALVQYLILK